MSGPLTFRTHISSLTIHFAVWTRTVPRNGGMTESCLSQRDAN